jgi:hypothetical protein
MKPSDMLPKPLSEKQKVKPTETGQRPAGEGWETITYEGEDGHRFEVNVRMESKKIGYSFRRWKISVSSGLASTSCEIPIG